MYDRKINMGLFVREELICGDFMCGGIRYFIAIGNNLFSPFAKVCVRKTTKNVCIFEFTKVSGCNTFPSYRLNTSNLYFFMRTT